MCMYLDISFLGVGKDDLAYIVHKTNTAIFRLTTIPNLFYCFRLFEAHCSHFFMHVHLHYRLLSPPRPENLSANVLTIY